MVMDHLKSCYTTQMRISLNPEIIATVRWYFCPDGALVPQTNSAFGSMVWENLDHEFPDPGLGEVNLTRTWDPGVAPPGVTGQGTPTPLDWFDDGVPADVVGPLAPCPGSLPAGPVLWWRPDDFALPVGTAFARWPAAPSTWYDGVVLNTQPLTAVDAGSGYIGVLLTSNPRPPNAPELTPQLTPNKGYIPTQAPSLTLSDYTIYAVFVPDGGPNWHAFAMEAKENGSWLSVLNALQTFDPNASPQTISGPSAAVAFNTIAVGRWQRAGTAISLAVNGQLVGTGTQTTTPYTPQFVNAFFGVIPDGGYLQLELIVWPRALGATELAAVDSYLAAKYRVSPYVDYSDMLIGQVVWDSGADAIPAKFLLSDGSPVSRVTYALLFARVGVVYGPGDGVNTFNLPNLKDRCAVGSYGSYATGASGGEATHTLVAAEIPAVPIVVHDPTHTHGPASGGNFEVDSTAATVQSGSDYQLGDSFTGSTTAVATGVTASQPTAGGGPHNNLQPYLALRPLIYAGV